MSTLIHHGYRLPTITSLTDLENFRKEVQLTLEPVHKELYLSLLASMFIDIVDMAKTQPHDLFLSLMEEYESVNAFQQQGKDYLLHRLKKEVEQEEFHSRLNEFQKLEKDQDHKDMLNRSILSHIIDVIEQKQQNISMTMIRNTQYDFECKVSCILSKGQVYALLYTEQEAYRKAWERLECVEHYPYWNNTDQPEGVSLEEWEARKVEWDSVLQHNAPATLGFELNLTLNTPTFQLEELLAYLPPFEKRVEKLTYEHMISEKQRELQQEKTNDVSSLPLSGVMELFFKAKKWMKSEEAEEKWETDYQRIAKQIQQTFTEEDFKQKIQTFLP